MIYQIPPPKTSENTDGTRTLGLIASGAATAIAINKNTHPIVAIGGFAMGAAISKHHPKAGLALAGLALLLSL